MINSQTIVTKTIVDGCAERLLVLKYDYYLELYQQCSKNQKQFLKALTYERKNIFSADISENTDYLPQALYKDLSKSWLIMELLKKNSGIFLRGSILSVVCYEKLEYLKKEQ